MFDFLGGILDAWREIAHFAEWTGVSLGVLAVLGVLAYLDPVVRSLAIRLAIVAVLIYAVGLWREAVGQNDIRAQWAAADVAAKKSADERDAAAAQIAEQKYGPILAARDSMIAEQNRRIETYEKQTRLPSCPLGSGALFLRSLPAK